MIRHPLALLLALALATCAFADGRPSIQAWFGPHPVGSPRGLDTHFTEFVRSAKTSLDGAFYELRLDSLTAEFVAAHKRGVKVRILVDDANFYGKDEAGAVNRRTKNPFVKQLLDAGIEVKQDANRRALMHNKFAIADGERVWSGSYNLTDTCTMRNQNNGLWLESAALAKVFTTQFEEMYVQELFGPKRPSTLKDQTVKVGDQTVEVLFAPEDDPLKRQLELIGKAQHSVHFMQFAFTADAIADALIERAGAGKCDVKGILDHRLYRSTGPYSEFAKLTSAGIPVVVYQKGEGKFHHKVFIIDAGTPDAVVITGSENTSNNGNEANDENVLIIRDPAIVSQFEKTFAELLGKVSNTQADMVYGELPIAGETLSSAELYVYSNGKPVSDVQIEFPARWPVTAETIAKMTVTVGGQAFPKENVKIENKKAIISGVNLTASGPRALMEIKLEELACPKIAGGYSPLVSVKSGGGFTPLAQQPVIKVYAADNQAAVADMFDHLRVMFHKLGRLENVPGSDVDKMRAAWMKDFERMRRSVIAAATGKRFKQVEAVIAQLEAFDPADLKVFGELTANARELKRALAAHADDQTAQGLLERLKTLTGSAAD